jgi:UDP-N-acetylmuramate dehydrogenase
LNKGLSGLEFAYGIPGSAGGSAFMNAGAYGGEMKNILLSCNHVSKKAVIGTLNSNELGLSYRHSIYRTNGFMITGIKIQLEEKSKSEIKDKMNDVLEKRRQKQPLDLPSAGSVFKRPENRFAGELIESCGLKGFSVGGAAVSQKHAGFIVNTGQATYDDVYELVKIIKDTVYKNTCVVLETEIQFIQ